MVVRMENKMKKNKPNILFMMSDHQLLHQHGVEYGPKIIRNNYEEFVKEGVEFTRAYSSNPLCGPTRRCVLSGLYSHHHGEILNDVNVPYTQRTYLDILKDEGYRNYYYGKWHAGPGTAHDHGCDGYCYPSYGNPYITKEYLEYRKEKNLPQPEIMIENTMDPWRLDIKPGEKYIQNKEWSNEQASGIMLAPKESHEAFFLADMVCKKLEQLKNENSDKPFSMRLDFWGPHDPYFVTQEYADLYDPSEIPMYPTFDSDLSDKPECYKKEHNLGISDENQNLIIPNPIPWSKWQMMIARAYSHITMIDDAMGIVLNKLKELGLEDDTMVVMTTDHGDALACQGGKFDKASYMVEEVMRVPLAIRYPGVIKKGLVSDALVSNLDIPVTILDAIGSKFDYEPDGKSLLDLISHNFKNRREFFVSETYGHLHRNLAKSMVTQRYKYTVNKEDMSELYDLIIDPFETKNLIYEKKYQALIKEMDDKLHKWVKEQGDNFFDGDSQYVLDELLSRGTSKPRDY